MTTIHVIKTMAKNGIAGQIELGEELITRLTEVGSTSSYKEILNVQKDQDNWSLATLSLLYDYLLDDDAIANEYREIVVSKVNANKSLFDNKIALRAGIDQRIAWLKQLNDRINDFQQSELTS